ncbi:MAG: hypothetical protein FJY82_14700 [Candidatus Aminicenantes bacterium]|nr:hypothetical protein [Candidatus Aminicenantes bacterium]
MKSLSATGRTVFALRSLRLLWRLRPETTKIAAKRMVDRGLLHRVARGYVSLQPDFDPKELANLIISPSYVSLATALALHGVSFQSRGTVDSVALLNYRRRAAGLEYRYFAPRNFTPWMKSGSLTARSWSSPASVIWIIKAWPGRRAKSR